MNTDKFLDAREAIRAKAEAKSLERISALEEKAAQMIGELNSGKCYVYPVGGQYREGTRAELVQYLVRNSRHVIDGYNVEFQGARRPRCDEDY